MRKFTPVLAALLFLAVNTFHVQAAGVVPGELEKKIMEAKNEFNSLSKHEKKSRIKEAKKAIKEYKKNVKDGKDEDGGGAVSKVLLIILAIILPPLAVFLHEKRLNGKFWLSLLLTLLFWLPGVIYALIVIL